MEPDNLEVTMTKEERLKEIGRLTDIKIAHYNKLQEGKLTAKEYNAIKKQLHAEILEHVDMINRDQDYI